MKKRIFTLLIAFAVGLACFGISGEDVAAAVKKPAKVKTVSVANINYDTLKITWSKAANAKKYQVFRAVSKNGKYKKIVTTTKLSYINKKLTTGKKYFYKVRAVNGVRYGDFSPIKSTASRVKVVKGVKAKSTCYNSVTLVWNKVEGANGYQIRYKRAGSFTYSYVNNVKNTSRKVKGLYKGVRDEKYEFNVRAYRIVNGKKQYGFWSNKIYTTTSLKPVKNLKAEQHGDTIKVTWTKVPNAEGYRIYRIGIGNYSEYFKDVRVAGGDKTSYIDTGLTEGITYRYTVEAYQTIKGKHFETYADKKSNKVKFEVAKYTYEVYLLEDYFNRDVYSDSSGIFVYLKTEDPNPDLFVFTTITDGGKEDEVAMMGYPDNYADLTAAMIEDNGVGEYGERVPGGYVFKTGLRKPGTYTIRLLRYVDDYSRVFMNGNPEVYDEIAAFKLTGLNSDYYYDKWIRQVVRDHTSDGMNPLQKFESIVSYLNSDEAGFRYKSTIKGQHGIVQIALGPDKSDEPFWVKKRWDSYVSPTVLADIAKNYIGGFDNVDNLFDNYSNGTPEWNRYHFFCRVTYNGITSDYTVCPPTESGYLEKIEVPDFNDTSWMFKIN